MDDYMVKVTNPKVVVSEVIKDLEHNVELGVVNDAVDSGAKKVVTNHVDNLIVYPNVVVSEVIKDLEHNVELSVVNDAVDKAVTGVAGVVVIDSGLVDIEFTQARKIVDDLVGSQSGEASGIPYISNKIEKLIVKRKPPATVEDEELLTDEASGPGLRREKHNTKWLVDSGSAVELVHTSEKKKKKIVRKRNPAPETIVEGEQQSDEAEDEHVERERLVTDEARVQNENEAGEDGDVVLPKKGHGRPPKSKGVAGGDLKKRKGKAAAVEGERMVTDEAEVENESAKDGDDVVLSKLFAKKGRRRPPKVQEDAGVICRKQNKRLPVVLCKKGKKKAAAVEVPPRKHSDRRFQLMSSRRMGKAWIQKSQSY